MLLNRNDACRAPFSPLSRESMKAIWYSFASMVLALNLSGCLTQRTVTEGGETVSQEYVIKRPIKDVIENSQ